MMWYWMKRKFKAMPCGKLCLCKAVSEAVGIPGDVSESGRTIAGDVSLRLLDVSVCDHSQTQDREIITTTSSKIQGDNN